MTLPAQDPNSDDARPVDGEFESFFERWYPSVLSYARRFGPAHAEEVAQETLFRAFNCFSELRRDNPLPWLRTVARNVACDMHRAGSRLWPLPEPGETDPVDRAEGPEESLLRLERVGHMRAALGDISAEDRRLLHMLVVNENSVVDVADQLDVTANVVRVRLHRARRRLGSHYLRRAGQQALALPALGLAALRRLLRPTTSTATRSAPALVAVAALGGFTAATVILSQPSAPVHAWSAPVTDQHTYTEPTPGAFHPRPVATRVSTSSTFTPTRQTPRGSAKVTPVAVPAVKTRLHLGDPKAPGDDAGFGVSVPTPVGTFYVSADYVRGAGDGLVCQVTGQAC